MKDRSHQDAAASAFEQQLRLLVLVLLLMVLRLIVLAPGC